MKLAQQSVQSAGEGQVSLQSAVDEYHIAREQQLWQAKSRVADKRPETNKCSIGRQVNKIENVSVTTGCGWAAAICSESRFVDACTYATEG